MQQTFLFEVALGSAGLLAAIVEIALGDDSERADGGEHPAFGAVDLVHAVAFSHRPALTSAREVEVLREHIARVSIGWMIAYAASATAARASVPGIAAVSPVIASRIVSFQLDPPHGVERHKATSP